MTLQSEWANFIIVTQGKQCFKADVGTNHLCNVKSVYMILYRFLWSSVHYTCTLKAFIYLFWNRRIHESAIYLWRFNKIKMYQIHLRTSRDMVTTDMIYSMKSISYNKTYINNNLPTPKKKYTKRCSSLVKDRTCYHAHQQRIAQEINENW